MGDIITCSAEGNPKPDIRWLDEQNDTLSDSHRLVIQESMIGLQTFISLVTNMVRGQPYDVSQQITACIMGKIFSVFLYLNKYHCKSSILKQISRITCLQKLAGLFKWYY